MKIIASNRYYVDKEEMIIVNETKASYFVKFSSCPDQEKSLRLNKKIIDNGGCEMRGYHNIRMIG